MSPNHWLLVSSTATAPSGKVPSGPRGRPRSWRALVDLMAPSVDRPRPRDAWRPQACRRRDARRGAQLQLQPGQRAPGFELDALAEQIRFYRAQLGDIRVALTPLDAGTLGHAGPQYLDSECSRSLGPRGAPQHRLGGKGSSSGHDPNHPHYRPGWNRPPGAESSVTRRPETASATARRVCMA
jgi:hypothetical protein